MYLLAVTHGHDGHFILFYVWAFCDCQAFLVGGVDGNKEGNRSKIVWIGFQIHVRIDKRYTEEEAASNAYL